MTHELRVDPLTGLRVVIAGARADRPNAVPPVAPLPAIDPEADPFLAGHEDRTPPELDREPHPDDPAAWSARAVPNLFPALEADAPEPGPDARRDLFTAAAARGHSEVIVTTPDPVTTLAELDAGQVQRAARLWARRMRAHAGTAAHVHLSLNEREGGGASQPHSHAQLHALDFVPAAIARERERFGAYATRTMGQSLLGDYLQEEVRRRERVVAVDDEAVLLAPYASRVPYQLMVVPRKPAPRWEAPEDPLGVALLHDALRRLARRFGAPPPLTLWVRTAPQGSEQFCWRIDVLPRLVPMAGLELGAGLHVVPVAPEQAAAELTSA